VNFDAGAICHREIFLAAVARAKAQRAASRGDLPRGESQGPSGVVGQFDNPDELRSRLDTLDGMIAKLNAAIARAEGNISSLKQIRDAQAVEAGKEKMRDAGSSTVVTLTEVSRRTARKLRDAIDGLARLASQRATLQMQRRELITGRAG
jgi:hypothetical protein